jgi:catechol 2,3-dioxygenase-like lactoylglutathione lyase family enzyme
MNHLTIAVSSLDRSFDFYVNLLGFKPEGRWDGGAYLSAADLWLCLSVDNVSPANDYTHYAFSVEDSNFHSAVARLKNANVKAWKSNSSEGDSFYFLDPDGHKLEIHCGSLQTRLKSVQSHHYSGWKYPC